MLNLRTFFILVGSAVLLAGGFRLVLSQQVAPVDRSMTVAFYSVSQLTRPDGVQPTLRGARLANPKDWPASFYSVHSGGTCTSTLVGPRTLLTAAHCVPNGSTATLQLPGKVYKGICTESDLYAPGSADSQSADWAL